MFREIKKKQIILENRKPYKSDVTNYIRELNLIDWVYSSMRMDGSSLTREDVGRILKGEFIIDAAVSDHAAVENYCSAIKYANDILALGSDINNKIILQIHNLLSGGTTLAYRRGNPIVLAFGYNPPHASEVEEQMNLLLIWLYSKEFETNPLLKAAHLHNRFIEIFPFEENCGAMARFLLEYYLLRNGYPPVALGFSEQEYNGMIIKYLKEDDSQPFYNVLERAMFNKMEILMQLTAR